MGTEMSHPSTELLWRRAEPDRPFGGYWNAHTFGCEEARRLEGAATPGRAGEPENTDPDQVMAASLSSRRIMIFPASTVRPVADFDDRAVARPGRNATGRMPASRCDLHLVVRSDRGIGVKAAGPDRMQEHAQRYRYTANSLTGGVRININ